MYTPFIVSTNHQFYWCSSGIDITHCISLFLFSLLLFFSLYFLVLCLAYCMHDYVVELFVNRDLVVTVALYVNNAGGGGGSVGAAQFTFTHTIICCTFLNVCDFVVKTYIDHCCVSVVILVLLLIGFFTRKCSCNRRGGFFLVSNFFGINERGSL